MIKRLFIAVMMLMLFSCEKDDNASVPVDNDLLQGTWEDCENESYDLGGRFYTFIFEKDSFFMKRFEVSDYVLPNCNYINSWTEYVKGIFTLEKSELTLIGLYCDEDYKKLENSQCPEIYNTGKYEMQFNSVKYLNDTLILQNTEMNTWHGLIKLKKI